MIRTAQAYLGVYTLFAILGTMLLLSLQAIVSIAVILYFRKHHADDAGMFSTMIAPIIAFIAQVILVYMLVAILRHSVAPAASARTFPGSALRSS